jgi:hypothetical protein
VIKRAHRYLVLGALICAAAESALLAWQLHVGEASIVHA